MTKHKKGKNIILGLIALALFIFVIRFFFGGSWYSYLIGIGGLILLELFIVKLRGFFWKDKQGNKLSFKQFLKRFKQGIEGITPLQQSKTNLMGIWITITGIIAGIIVNLLVRLENMWWWILLILCGSLILTIIQFIGILQKYWRFKEIDKQMRQLENG